jgi:hypothetical protein
MIGSITIANPFLRCIWYSTGGRDASHSTEFTWRLLSIVCQQMTTNCCAECGKEEGGGLASLKACKSCMQSKYCNAACQKKHWPTHKKDCKQRAAELRDEALFKDPPAKEDCPFASYLCQIHW